MGSPKYPPASVRVGVIGGRLPKEELTGFTHILPSPAKAPRGIYSTTTNRVSEIVYSTLSVTAPVPITLFAPSRPTLYAEELSASGAILKVPTLLLPLPFNVNLFPVDAASPAGAVREPAVISSSVEERAVHPAGKTLIPTGSEKELLTSSEAGNCRFRKSPVRPKAKRDMLFL